MVSWFGSVATPMLLLDLLPGMLRAEDKVGDDIADVWSRKWLVAWAPKEAANGDDVAKANKVEKWRNLYRKQAGFIVCRIPFEYRTIR
mmetsp:Transcript_25492/g.56056  ORF Transcript_25492/g.56056 Transcript_25492/m.56056 type:complete len:88 (+) Transcript_25492:91-354(+)